MTDEEIVRWVAQADYLDRLPADLTTAAIYDALVRVGVPDLPPAGSAITRDSADRISAAASSHLRSLPKESN
jgi:hypothetical protein